MATSKRAASGRDSSAVADADFQDRSGWGERTDMVRRGGSLPVSRVAIRPSISVRAASASSHDDPAKSLPGGPVACEIHASPDESLVGWLHAAEADCEFDCIRCTCI